jgi:hypothetical protein
MERELPVMLHGQVTQAMIDTSVPCHAQRCLLATALRHRLPEATGILVDMRDVRLTQDRINYVYLPGDATAANVKAFDDKQPVGPFRFELERVAMRRLPRPYSKRPIKDATKRAGKRPKAAAAAKSAAAKRSSPLADLTPLPRPRRSIERVSGERVMK